MVGLGQSEGHWLSLLNVVSTESCDWTVMQNTVAETSSVIGQFGYEQRGVFGLS